MNNLGPGRPRCGFTLIEVAVVVAITSVLFAVSVTIFVALLRLERRMSADAARDLAVARLASRLRTDAHGASAADCSRDCIFAFADGTEVRYAYASGAVTREVVQDQVVRHRDSFRLGSPATARFSAQQAATGTLISLTITADSVNSRLPLAAMPWEILAAVNLHKQPTSTGAAP